MLWMNNTGLFSTRCDLVDECTEIMLRMGEGEMACYTSCARLVPSPREPGPLFANDPKSGQPRLTEVACWAHARRRSIRPGCRARAIRSAPPHLYPTPCAGQPRQR